MMRVFARVGANVRGVRVYVCVCMNKFSHNFLNENIIRKPQQLELGFVTYVRNAAS